MIRPMIIAVGEKTKVNRDTDRDLQSLYKSLREDESDVIRMAIRDRLEELDLLEAPVANKIEDLEGRILVKIENVENHELIFTFDNGDKYKLYHQQDCCEAVTIEDIIGDLDNLIGCPLLMADESSNRDDPPTNKDYGADSFTWTFYRFATKNGYVTVRWYGESNGYYSESVDFEKC